MTALPAWALVMMTHKPSLSAVPSAATPLREQPGVPLDKATDSRDIAGIIQDRFQRLAVGPQSCRQRLEAVDEQGRAEILAFGPAGDQCDIVWRFIHAFPGGLADFLRNLMAPRPSGRPYRCAGAAPYRTESSGPGSWR